MAINVLYPCDNQILNSLLSLFLDESSGERFENLIQKVMLQSTDGELQAVDFDDDLVTLKIDDLSLSAKTRCTVTYMMTLMQYSKL